MYRMHSTSRGDDTVFQDVAKPILANGKANGSLTFDAVLVLSTHSSPDHI